MSLRRLLTGFKSATLRVADGMVDALSRAAGIEAREGHHYLARHLGAGSIVVDLGAHLGRFAHPLAASSGCRVYAVEAVPALYEKIPAAPTLERLNFAVGSVSGPVSFFLSGNPEANSMSRALAAAWPGASPAEIRVHGMTLPELFQHLRIRRADLLKVDVEGAEIALFDAAPDDLLREIGQITVEFHDFMAEANLSADVERVLARLARLGFFPLTFSLGGLHGDVLLLNRPRLQLSRWQRLCVYHLLPALLALRDRHRRLILRLRARLPA